MNGLTSAALTLAMAFAGGEPAAEYTRTCSTHVEGPSTEPYEPDPRRDVVLGRVVFLGLGRFVPAPRLRKDTDPIAKVPVMVEAGTPVTVRIVPLRRTRARLDFDRREWRRRERRIATGAGQRSVRFDACPPETPRFIDGKPLGEQTGYNGGFLIARRGCARLVARAPGEEVVRRRVALGVRPRRCR